MPKLKGMTLPDDVVAEFHSLIEKIPPDAIIDYAKKKKLLRGFRPIKQNLKQIQKFVKSSIKPNTEIDPVLCSFMQGFSLHNRIIICLSKEAIENALVSFLGYYGENAFLAGMLLNDRKEVFELAKNWIENTEKKPLPDKTKAREKLQDIFTLFCNEFREILTCDEKEDKKEEQIPEPAGVADTSAQLTVENKELRKHSEQVEKRCERLKQQHDRETAKLNKEITRLKESLKKTNEKLKTADNEKESTLNELNTLRKSIREKIKSEIQKYNNSLMKDYLRHPQKLNETATLFRKEQGTEKLLRQSELALKEQAGVDRNFGNRTQLEGELKDLTESLEKIRNAVLNSINPLAKLKELETAIENRIDEINSILKKPDIKTEFAEQLRARINGSEADDLVQLRGFIDECVELDTISRHDARSLYKACLHRLQYYYDQYGSEKKRRLLTEHAPLFLTKATEDNQPCILYLDGHNIIHLIYDIFSRHYEEGKPGKKAMEELINIMKGLSSSADNINIRIYYDSPYADERVISENVRVIYSGGDRTEAHRADNVILKDLNDAAENVSAAKRFVITDDRDLRNQAVELGASGLSIEEFGLFLELLQRKFSHRL